MPLFRNKSTPNFTASNTDGNLLILLIAVFYSLFTLSSTNQTVVWPWVALWQTALLLPMVWLLWQVWHKPLVRFRLGNGFDWLVGLAVVGLLVSTLAADFPSQAIWYGLGLLGGAAALYGLMGWLTPPRLLGLLKGQASLALVFIVGSLGQWWFNIYRPEMQRLATLRAYGIEQSFNFDELGLRNWYPLGHQNYVGGYLLLLLPLLLGLALTERGWQRWLWGGGAVLALVDLYTTHSRGAFLGLLAMIAMAVVGLLLVRRTSRRVVLPVGLLGGAIAAFLILSNPRVRTSLAALREGNLRGSQLAYRLINNVIGWNMGQARPWAGQGPGSVPILYQHFRPFWAGREAELHYQLHSTPAQLWAEGGLWGIGLPVAGAILLGVAWWRQRHQPLAARSLPPLLRWSLITGLWGYAVLSLTDFQLDVIAISGGLIIFLAVLCFDLRPAATPCPTADPTPRRHQGLALVGLGLVLAFTLWLIPVHRAWAISARGFVALEKGDIPAFATDLEQAHRLAPWEPYYPFMLGWVLGDLSFQVEAPEAVTQLRADAIQWFQQGNEVSPFQEFGHSNLGWLVLRESPTAAIAQFVQSAQLIPAKLGVFYGLGASLLLAEHPDLAVDAIALELLRNPALLPNFPLNGGLLTDLLPAIAERVEALSRDILAVADSPLVINHVHQVRGALRWWRNDYAGAQQDWQQTGNAISLAVLATAMGESPDLAALPDLPGKFALQAWADPTNRRELLEAAWIAYDETIPQLSDLQAPEPQIDALLAAMNESATFEQWLKENVVYVRLRNERLGFGLLMRHDDGPSPSDFYFRQENLAMSRFFDSILPFRGPNFIPQLDRLLQPEREAVIRQALALS